MLWHDVCAKYTVRTAGEPEDSAWTQPRFFTQRHGTIDHEQPRSAPLASMRFGGPEYPSDYLRLSRYRTRYLDAMHGLLRVETCAQHLFINQPF